MKKQALWLPLALTLALSPALAPLPALAHGNTTPQHGGIVQLSGETLVELVAGTDGTSVFVAEEDEPVPASDLTVTLTVMDPAGKRQVEMVPATGNRLDAPGLKLAAGTKIGALIVNKTNQVRTIVAFTVK
jgi:hypothetical protein